MVIKIETPLTDDVVRSLKAGDEVVISGVVYSARDMAHMRICEAIEKGEKLPFGLEGAVVYFVGPTPAGEERAIGAAGPTTSSRMDAFSPILYGKGLGGTIGKGYRSLEVRRALKENCAVHFAACGGAAALLSRHIAASEVIAYDDLGTEAVRKLRFEDFPVVVAYDCHGSSVYRVDENIED
jgi:fumarate hydratase subunit beta